MTKRCYRLIISLQIPCQNAELLALCSHTRPLKETQYVLINLKGVVIGMS